MVLITGAKGEIGSYLVHYLNAKASTDDITAMTVSDLEGIDVVINCAGKKYDTTDEEFHFVNVEGTRNLAQICLKKGIKMVHLSTIAINGPYGKSKQQGQKVVEALMRKGLQAVILRLCSIGEPHPHRRRYPISELLKDIQEILKDFKPQIIDYARGDFKRSYPVI